MGPAGAPPPDTDGEPWRRAAQRFLLLFHPTRTHLRLEHCRQDNRINASVSAVEKSVCAQFTHAVTLCKWSDGAFLVLSWGYGGGGIQNCCTKCSIYCIYFLSFWVLARTCRPASEKFQKSLMRNPLWPFTVLITPKNGALSPCIFTQPTARPTSALKC